MMAWVQSAAWLHMHRHACRQCRAAVPAPRELPAGEGQLSLLTRGSHHRAVAQRVSEVQLL